MARRLDRDGERMQELRLLPEHGRYKGREITMDTITLIILVVVLFLVFGGGGGYYWKRR